VDATFLFSSTALKYCVHCCQMPDCCSVHSADRSVVCRCSPRESAHPTTPRNRLLYRDRYLTRTHERVRCMVRFAPSSVARRHGLRRCSPSPPFRTILRLPTFVRCELQLVRPITASDAPFASLQDTVRRRVDALPYSALQRLVTQLWPVIRLSASPCGV
jgi:hypothetical protein